MSKYAPLGEYLRKQTVDLVTLSFDDVADIIGDTLPASASKFRQWWENQTGRGHTNAEAWMNASWKVESVSLLGQRVTFVRG